MSSAKEVRAMLKPFVGSMTAFNNSDPLSKILRDSEEFELAGPNRNGKIIVLTNQRIIFFEGTFRIKPEPYELDKIYGLQVAEQTKGYSIKFKYDGHELFYIIDRSKKAQDLIDEIKSKLHIDVEESDEVSKISEQATDINGNLDKPILFEFKLAERATITLDGNFIRLNKRGLRNAINSGLNGEKTFRIRDLSGIQIKKPGVLSGYIQFVYPGANEVQGVWKSVQNENTVMLGNKDDLAKAEQIKEYFENKSNELDQPVGQTIVQQQLSPADEIKKYKELLDMGAVTQEEFDAKKKQLLGI